MYRVLALAAALVAVGVAAVLSFGSSHREAPNISQDPTGDNTDVYAFTAKDAPGSLTVVANWIPLEDPAGGPNFYGFDPKARYYVRIDNTGDGKPDVSYRWQFKTTTRNPNSFLYAKPEVSSFNDPDLNVVQTYSLYRETPGKRGSVKSVRIAKNLPVAPNNVGPNTIPNYNAVASSAIRGLSGGYKSFAGQIDDPFFVDLGATFDAINIRSGTGNAGGGKDDVAGYNTHSVVLQVPEADVTRNGKAVAGPTAGNAVVGVWSTTERRKLQVTDGSTSASSSKGRKSSANPYVQVSRLGNPLVNEVVIPLGKKDQFNRTTPDRDGALYGKYVVTPELAKIINSLFPGLNVPEKNRTDIVEALLTGIPGVTQIAPKAPPTDTLKVNLGVPPSATEKPFGVIGGDTAGFPNGRRLGDDVVDIELRVVGGFLKGNKLPLGDGVNRNDKPFRASFPYVAAPSDGFNSQPKRLEPASPPVGPQP
jgi:Domain of unknown function (DUF4331)